MDSKLTVRLVFHQLLLLIQFTFYKKQILHPIRPPDFPL